MSRAHVQPLHGPDIETLDVELYRVALDTYAFHYQLVFRDGFLTAVTGLPIPRTAPDAEGAVVRQEATVL